MAPGVMVSHIYVPPQPANNHSESRDFVNLAKRPHLYAKLTRIDHLALFCTCDILTYYLEGSRIVIQYTQ